MLSEDWLHSNKSVPNLAFWISCPLWKISKPTWWLHHLNVFQRCNYLPHVKAIVRQLPSNIWAFLNNPWCWKLVGLRNYVSFCDQLFKLCFQSFGIGNRNFSFLKGKKKVKAKYVDRTSHPRNISCLLKIRRVPEVRNTFRPCRGFHKIVSRKGVPDW